MISTTKKILNKISSSTIFFIIGLIILIFIWFISSKQIDNEFVLPEINLVVNKLLDFLSEGKVIKIVLLTILKVFLIIGLCFLISLVLAILSYKFKWLYGFISPILVIIRTAPIAAIIVILLICVGLKQTPYYICSFVVVPVIYEQILQSFNSIDKDIIEETKMISNINMNVFVKVFIPMAFPNMISAVLTVFGLGLKVLVMAEVFSSNDETFGGLLQSSRSALDMPGIFALTIIMIIVVVIVEGVLKFIKSKIRY